MADVEIVQTVKVWWFAVFMALCWCISKGCHLFSSTHIDIVVWGFL